VIGGGVAGLACARELVDRHPEVEVTLLESAPQVGGVIGTHRRQGFSFEGGPHGFLNRDPSTVQLAVRLGLRNELIGASAAHRGRFMLRRGHLVRFPDRPRHFFTSSLLSLAARARLLAEPWAPRQALEGDVSIGSFFRARLGHEATELLIDPIVSGIYGGDLDRLSLLAALPQAAGVAKRGDSVLAAALRHARAPAVQPGAAGLAAGGLVSFRRGTAQLIEALADSLSPLIVTRAPVHRLVRDGRRWRVSYGDGGEIAAEAVVVAAPAPQSAAFLAAASPELARVLATFVTAPVATVALGYAADDIVMPARGFGYLVPRQEGGSVLGVLWPGNMFPGLRSPPTRVQVQAIVGGARAPHVVDAADETIVHEVVGQLRGAMAARSSPLVAEVFRHTVGIAQYEVGHGERVVAARQLAAALPGVVLTGSSYDGIGVNACTAAALRAAVQVSEHLRSLARRSVTAPHSKSKSSMARQRSSP
jgi:protoporphyrinogen/coproporphyrinogen III oxidase